MPHLESKTKLFFVTIAVIDSDEEARRRSTPPKEHREMLIIKWMFFSCSCFTSVPLKWDTSDKIS
jgi:hypothetical protein